MTNQIAICWFRQDLRLHDNPALTHCSEIGPVLPIFIFDTKNPGEDQYGAASRCWLHHSLEALQKTLAGKLALFTGDPEQILLSLTKKLPVAAVYWNRCYAPWQIQRDQKIKERLKAAEIEVKSFNGSLLWEPWEINKKDGTPYRVFTPFYRNGCLTAAPPREPLPKPPKLTLFADSSLSTSVADLNLLPAHHWGKQMMSHWQPGEQGAAKRLDEFLDHGITDYKEGRNFPSKRNVSRLSPHFHWGELSPNEAWYSAKAQYHDDNLQHFLSELGWREFSYHLLYQFPDLPRKNLQAKFDAFPWQQDQKKLTAWQRGQTGYPIVDAGMRELWQTGYMHNRVRMVVGSFLVKNLLLHWTLGEKWFWDCLVDADLANNSASWQWIAGCGADAAPYFRIFNPITQGQKFDPHGEYTRKFVPELEGLPDNYLFNPWEAPPAILQQANLELGKNYPFPIVDVKSSREKALKAYGLLQKEQ